MILRPEACLQEKNGRVWFATCLPPSRTRACNLRHPNEDQLVLQKPSKINLILLFTLSMYICLSRLSNTLTSVQGGTSEKEAKIQMNGCHLICVQCKALSMFCTLLVCIVVSTNPFIRCGHLAHQEKLYFLLLSTVIDLSNSKQNYVLTAVKIVTRMISLLHFGKCGNSFLRITENIMLSALM